MSLIFNCSKRPAQGAQRVRCWQRTSRRNRRGILRRQPSWCTGRGRAEHLHASTTVFCGLWFPFLLPRSPATCSSFSKIELLFCSFCQINSCEEPPVWMNRRRIESGRIHFCKLFHVSMPGGWGRTRWKSCSRCSRRAWKRCKAGAVGRQTCGDFAQNFKHALN